MTLAGIARWTWQDLRAHRVRFAVAAVGVAAGVAALCFFLSLAAGVRAFVVGDVATKTEATLVEVVPPSLELGVFRLSRPGLFGSGGIDNGVLERLKRLPGVAAVYPRRALRVPLGAEGGGRLFGKEIYSDLFAEGIDERLLAAALGQALAPESDVIPVVINPHLVQLFNHSVAPALGVPQLADGAVLGLTFKLIIGRSYLMGTQGATHVAERRARIIGFSKYAPSIGVSMPLAVVDGIERGFRAEARDGGEAPLYTAAFVRLASADAMAGFAASVERVGLKISTRDRQAADAIRLATLGVGFIGGLVLLVAAFNIGHLFVAQLAERRGEHALLLALGASPATLWALTLTQAVAIGLAGAAAGVGIGFAATRLVESALGRYIGDMPLRPAHFFIFAPSLVALAFALAVIAAVIGAALPLLALPKQSPARVLMAAD